MLYIYFYDLYEVMYITEVITKTKKGKPSHRCILLRESFRKDGKVCNRTIANLTHCSPEEVAALRLVLEHKKQLDCLRFVDPTTAAKEADFSLEQGASIGATWTVYHVARQLGIEAALGDSWQAKLALWQVLARVIDQGSRLSAVRLAQTHSACDVLGIRRGFDENDLYTNLAWLTQKQADIEEALFAFRWKEKTTELYFYDVTSTYLEGHHNALGAFGYNRDGKRGKKQLVIGLLCDQTGTPVSIEVFVGNTCDTKTFASQVQKAAERFGSKHVCFVGDRGMIKTPQIKQLQEQQFHYISAITKPQIRKLLEQKVFQMELFEQPLAEIQSPDESCRYILRCNPVRASQMKQSRQDKLQAMEEWIFKANADLSDHPLRKAETRLRWAQQRIRQLKLNAWLSVQAQGRILTLVRDPLLLAEEQKLDGCYVLVTDMDPRLADKQLIHQRYKDLAEVEQIFRSSKTVNLEMRPVHVRKDPSTRGHALVVMLASLIMRHLRRTWTPFNLTPEEGIKELCQLCSIKVSRQGIPEVHRIPKPGTQTAKLLAAIDVQLPEVLPSLNTRVVTRKKLQPSRKKR